MLIKAIFTLLLFVESVLCDLIKGGTSMSDFQFK